MSLHMTTATQSPHEVGVVLERGRRPAAISRRRPQPGLAPAQGVDKRESPRGRGPRSARAAQPGRQRESAHREPGRQGLAIAADAFVISLGVEQQQASDDQARPPPQVSCHFPCSALVPAHRPLDPSFVFDLGLDLVDRQSSRSRVECEQVDPAVGAAIGDVDFAGRQAAGAFIAALGVGDTTRARRFELTLPVGKERRSEIEAGLDAERVEQRGGRRQREGALHPATTAGGRRPAARAQSISRNGRSGRPGAPGEPVRDHPEWRRSRARGVDR